jgi:hypothetical protein
MSIVQCHAFYTLNLLMAFSMWFTSSLFFEATVAMLLVYSSTLLMPVTIGGNGIDIRRHFFSGEFPIAPLPPEPR